VRWPGTIKPGTVCDELIFTHDFYPTLMEIAWLRAADSQV
jgi:arylsulfatase A-like enzyme